jgi:hypothetical protein
VLPFFPAFFNQVEAGGKGKMLRIPRCTESSSVARNRVSFSSAFRFFFELSRGAAAFLSHP